MYNQTIDMVIRLEDWNREANYDRLGLDEEYIEFLGNKVVCYSIPFVRAVIWRLSLSLQQLIIEQRRWDIMRHRNCTTA